MTFDSLCFQALAWTADGELDPVDKLVLLNNLIRQATPSEQIELIPVSYTHLTLPTICSV